MQFDSQAQHALFERVSKWTRDLFGELIEARADHPVIDFCYGPLSGRVVVGSINFTDRPYLTISCLVDAGNVRLTEEVTRFLMAENTKLCIGALGVNQSGQVLFSHSIYGDTITKEDFKPLMKIILTGALAVREMLLAGVGSAEMPMLSKTEARIH